MGEGRLPSSARADPVSGVAAVVDAQLLYGSGASIERSGRAPGFRDLRHEVWRERGFGDFWGYALVAEGAAEAMIEVGVNPWDLAAPEVVVEEAGGLLTDLGGAARIDGLEVLATNGVLHDELLAPTRRRGAARADGHDGGGLGGAARDSWLGPCWPGCGAWSGRSL